MSDFIVPEITGFTPSTFAMEVDIEYDNGWRETVTVSVGEKFIMPFDGKIVAMRPVVGA